MKALGNKPWIATLGLIALAISALVATPTNAKADESAAVNYDCYGSICVGTGVRVNYGYWTGQTGSVVGIDRYDSTFTLVNAQGYYLYPRFNEVSPLYSNPSQGNCVSHVCVGDQIQFISGHSRGLVAQVIGTNPYSFTATVMMSSGRYLTEDVRNLYVLSRNARPPQSRNPQMCPHGQIYDVYRGCVYAGGRNPQPIPPRRGPRRR